MAKRFGRNRRRHLRVDAQRGREATLEYNNRLYELNRSCVDWIKDVAQLYGENSAFLPDPPKIYVREGQEFPLTVFAQQRRDMSPMDFSAVQSALHYEPEPIRRQILDSWYAMSEPDIMRAATLVRLIQVKGNRSNSGEQFSYSLGDHQVMVTKDFEMLGEIVKRKMVQHLEHHFGKQRSAA